jgi:hypothetical protein
MGSTTQNQPCALFIFPLGGIIVKKVWVGSQDGVVHRIDEGGMICDFVDVRLNTGLDGDFLGADITTKDVPVVSESQLRLLFPKK